MAAQRPDFATLLRVDVAAEDHQGLDGFGHERGGLVGVGEGIRTGPRGLGAAAAGGIDLGLDDAGVAVVDGAQNRDGAPIPSGVANKELAGTCGSLIGCVGHGFVAAAL